MVALKGCPECTLLPSHQQDLR